MNKIVISLVASLVVIALSASALFFSLTAEKKIVETGVQGIAGIAGEKGEQGLRGYQGIPGVKGDKGDKGDAGANAVVDYNLLSTKVADILADREDQPLFLTDGGVGNFTRSFTVEDAGEYHITLSHWGIGDFKVSLVDEDNNVVVLIDTEGHIKTVDTRNLDEETYTLRISSTGDWEVEVEGN